MKPILVTGASGFLGRHCLPLLQQYGYEITAVTAQAPTAKTNGVHWRQADLLNPGQVDELLQSVRPIHVLHLAWYTNPVQYWTSPVNEEWLSASIHFLKRFFELGGKRFVGAGSCAEYEWTGPAACSEDSTPLRPASLYGACKNKLRAAMEELAQLHGASTAWGRLFFLYGPHERRERLIPSMILTLLAGQPVRCNHPALKRDFIHVEDAASAFIRLMASDASGAFNIGTGTPAQIKDVVQEIGRQIGNQKLIQYGADSTDAEAPAVVADRRKMRLTLNWEPSIELTDGIRSSIRWWTEHAQTSISTPGSLSNSPPL